MSEAEQEVEQITAPPTEPKKPEKDPKKIAAGKKLAEYNKKAKLALQRDVQREKEESAIEESRKDSGWFPKISFSTAVSLVGIVLGGINLYFRLKPKDDFVHEMKVIKADHIKSEKAHEPGETKSNIPIRVEML